MQKRNEFGLKIEKMPILRGEEAERISEALQKSGILQYIPRNELGHMVLDVYTE